ncbi:MAG: formate--tetrahydrofolate ligase [Corynebacterium sp.]|nr:formate--tetrahydrofolate ligase [Corynebacterium sp.]
MTDTVTTVPSDVEIAQAHHLVPIETIAHKAGIPADAVIAFGRSKAKLDVTHLPQDNPGALVLVTAMSPTPAGEGKTTTLIGLADALALEGRNVMVTLREPSQGPVMGLKGGAAGGGYSQVVPMEDINLHFTGDFHAIAAANNTIAAVLDSHINHDNELGIDPRQITWRRCLDVNDRSLRHIVTGLGGKSQGTPRETGFDITAASELMAVLCLAEDLSDLRARIERIVVGYSYSGEPVTVGQLGVAGAAAALLKDAIRPNLVQTLGGVPALIHGGPFANIAHGTNSIIATRAAQSVADYVCIEAGFGSDLGAEKFYDIVAPTGGFSVATTVVVATIRALKYNGGVAREDLNAENLSALEAGAANLTRHVNNVRKFGSSPIVALNMFTSDSPAEVEWLMEWGRTHDVPVVHTRGWEHGGEGARELARTVIAAVEDAVHRSHPLYDPADGLEHSIETIAREIYGADAVHYSATARTQLAQIVRNGWDTLPVCISKTQYSFSDDAALLGAPTGFVLHIRSLVPKIGAGFIVALTGSVMTLPGLGKHPAAMNIDIDGEGTISGLF